MIDFSRIHSFSQGQRSSFEELVCQLARHEDFPEHSIYKRIEGAGGDGGIEAYWTKPSGKKTGYQAKYFLRSGDIDWGQIDKSVTKAIEVHTELECYVVALPCDLTERTGKKQQGKTGWEHWDARVEKWTKEAEKVGITEIEFQPWTTSELVTKLARKSSEGLMKYFFGDLQLSIEWFDSKVQEAVLALDERFHPEDHVSVRLEQLFSVISRAPSHQKKLLGALEHIQQKQFKSLSDLKQQPDNEKLEELRESFDSLAEINKQIKLDPQHNWDAKNWTALVAKLQEVNNSIQKWSWEYRRTLDNDDEEQHPIIQLIRDTEELREAIDEFKLLVQPKNIVAENNRVALVGGKAGSGKSHLLAQCAQNAIARNQPAILVLGQQLNDSDFWFNVVQLSPMPLKS